LSRTVVASTVMRLCLPQITDIPERDILFVRFDTDVIAQSCLPYFIALDRSTKSIGMANSRLLCSMGPCRPCTPLSPTVACHILHGRKVCHLLMCLYGVLRSDSHQRDPEL
jgi:hypothetical protein